MNVLLALLTLFLSSAVSSAFTIAPTPGPPPLLSSLAHGSSRSSPPAAQFSTSTSTTRLSMIFGPKDDGTPGDYVCKDCGYVFTKGPQAWAALPADYSCPPCGAAKWRFTKVPKGSASGKVTVKGGGNRGSAGNQSPAKKKGLFG